VADVQDTIFSALRSLLDRRQHDAVVTLESSLYEDLELDSLEVAEFSAVLEDDLGRDPYSEGLVPQTVGEVVAFYAP
jgi:acyl carrier protein